MITYPIIAITALCLIALLFYKKNWKLIYYYFLYGKKRISQDKNNLSWCFRISSKFLLFTVFYLLIEYLPKWGLFKQLILSSFDDFQLFYKLLKENETSIIIWTLIIEVLFIILCFIFIIKSPVEQKKINNDLMIKKIVNYKGINIFSYFGSIKDVSNINVIVTSENSDLDLASLSSTSISGRVRYMASTKNDIGNVINDPLSDNIIKFKRKMNKNNDFILGTCIISLPFELKKQGVKCIIHAVSIKKNSDNTIYSDKDAIKEIINYSIEHCVNKNFNSIFIPIFGIGSAQRDYIKSITLQLEQLKTVLDNKSASITYDLDIYLGVYRELDDLYLKKTAFKMFR